ncbi:Oidioi.mRNA.OKI2018_I69.PAR.g9647.t1.cds [Oikopleura dioica]|uniref:Oidioi.mRNA.OKI2018_I69.PAR.g9647.t1.cds n=1 Tax=Oikopleura dioica TaxID=34765 RepID=A0ABN7RLI3_OIKDI|nr:Oidioi.mRNA.OKI2018_I69.PAR.g9647.t1.cds [Oikopleura dioica]
MLIISFFICWTPLHVVHVLLMSGVRIPLSYCALMQDMANVFAWANPVLNPLLYAFAGKQFRSDFRKLLRRRKESGNRRFFDESPSLTHEQSQEKG